MKTTLLSLLLALSPGLAVQLMAQEGTPDAPREAKKEPTEREHHRAMEAGARQKMEQEMKATMEEAAKLEEVGKKDEAQKLRREAKERMHGAMMEREKAARMHGPDAPGPRPHADGPPRAELENKLKHVEMAIGHLREAGMEDAAMQINRMADRLRNALRGEHKPRPESDRHEEGKHKEGKRDQSKHDEAKHEEGKRDEAKHEDRRPDKDIEALRREVQELRQAVRQMNQRQSEP